ncbi:MAG: BASS family bile acid:Na+ symporter [Saprospiraceae bacterium]|jgi:BASS family bile acid:Na+ symporter
MKKSLLILASIAIGILFPHGHPYAFLIRYFLMIMLFFVFLNINIHRRIIQKLHLKILLANILIPVLIYFCLQFFNETVAIATFVIALAPTAVAAPIIAQLLNAKVEIVATSTLVTSAGMALVIPFLLPFIIKIEGTIDTLSVFIPIVVVVFVPLILAQIVKKTMPKVQQFLSQKKDIPLYLFLLNVYLAMAKSTNFIKTSEQMQTDTIFWIAMATGVLCILNFQIGERIVSKELKYEGGLALGRKNTMFILWLALTFVSPIAALSPIFYILWQNLYNSFQLWQKGRRETVNGGRLTGTNN